MSYNEQKEIASELDILAARCHQICATPATGKQCWFLASMIDRNDLDSMMLDSSKLLTKREASRLIDSYLKERSVA